MYTNKTHSENGSRKPRNYNQVTQKLKRAITKDYGSWMGNSLEDGDGKSYAGKSPMYKEALARKYNVSKSAVNYVLKEAKKEEVRKMADLYSGGKDVSQIAAKLGKSKRVVKSTLAKYNADPSKFENFDEMTPTHLKSNMYDNTEADKSKTEEKSWFSKYAGKVAAAAATIVAVAGLAYASATSKNLPNEPKAATSYSVKADANLGKAKGLEGTVKAALGEMKREEQSPLEDEAEEPEMGGDGDGDDLPGIVPAGAYNIGGDAYASASGQNPEPEFASDRPLDNKPKPEPQPTPQPEVKPTPEPEKQPQASPEDIEDLQRRMKEIDDYHKRMSNPQPAPTPAQKTEGGLFGERESESRVTELTVEPRLGFGYTRLSGDVTGGEARLDFGARATSNSGSTYDFNFRYSDKDESWTSAAGDDVDKTTTTMTPTFGITGKDKSFLFKYNHVESDETMNNSSRNVETIGESGLLITTTEGMHSEQKTNNALDAFSFGGKVNKFTFSGDIVSNKTKTGYDEDSYALVEFSDPAITPVLVNNRVGTTTSSTTNSYLGKAGWDFGNVEPGIIGRHRETDWKMNADLNGASILSESGSSNQNTLGFYSNFKFDKATGRFVALSNSGDDLDSSQKFEAAAHGTFLAGDNYVFGAGLERSDGGTKARGAFLWKLNGSKTGQDALKSVESYMNAAEDDNLFGDSTTKSQKREARLDKDRSAGADGVFLAAEGGQAGDEQGNYWRLDAAAPIPGTNGRAFVYGAFEDGDLEKRVEGGAGWKLGKHASVTWNYFNSQDKDNDLNTQGTGPGFVIKW